MADSAAANAAFVHRGTRAVQRMVEHAPSSGGLALWVRHEDLPESPEEHGATPTPPIVTDGQTLFYAPAFDELPLPRQAGLVAHAVLHVALRHVQRHAELQARSGDADLQLFNVCADAIVNSALSHLGWLQLTAGAVQLDSLLSTTLGLRQDAAAALLEWDVERLYRAIDDRRRGASGGARQQSAGSSPSDDAGKSERPQDGPRAAKVRAMARADAADLRPAAGTSGTAGAPEDEAELTRQWCERVLRAHAGDGAHSMLRALLADLPRSRTPWEQVLRAQLAHGLAQQPGISWSRPSRSYLANQGRSSGGRRMPWEPGRSAIRPVPRLAVVVDVSGSIDGALMQRFALEIEAISRRLEAGLVLVVGDDAVRRVEPFAPFQPGHSSLREIVFNGGGGTDFTPLLEEAQRHRPDMVVVLTDLQGPANFKPRCPVIWAVPPGPHKVLAPFGRLLALH